MGNEHSASKWENSEFCRDSGACCGRSGTLRSNKLIDILISEETTATSRISPIVEFDKSAWLREPQESCNKPQDESPDRLSDLQAARADRRRAFAVPVQPAQKQFEVTKQRDAENCKCNSPVSVVANAVNGLKARQGEYAKKRVENLARANQCREESKAAVQWQPGYDNPLIMQIAKHGSSKPLTKLDHRDPVAQIRSPAQKSIASSGHIELCTHLSAEKMQAYIVEALEKEVMSTSGEQKASASGILNFLNEEDALRAYERATGNQSSKNPRSPSGREIEKLILDQFGKDSTSYRYICLSKKIEGSQVRRSASTAPI